MKLSKREKKRRSIDETNKAKEPILHWIHSTAAWGPAYVDRKTAARCRARFAPATLAEAAMQPSFHNTGAWVFINSTQRLCFQVDEVQCLIEVDLKCRTHNASHDNNRNKQENELSVLSLSLSLHFGHQPGSSQLTPCQHTSKRQATCFSKTELLHRWFCNRMWKCLFWAHWWTPWGEQRWKQHCDLKNFLVSSCKRTNSWHLRGAAEHHRSIESNMFNLTCWPPSLELLYAIGLRDPD